MRISLVLALCAGLAFPAAGRAQTSAPPAPRIAQPTPAAIGLSRELVALLQLREIAVVGMRTAMSSQQQQLGTGPEADAARRTVEQWGVDIFATEEALNAFARIYAETFTEAELRELLAFHRSPIGQRLLQEQAHLMERGADVGRQLAETNMPDLMDRLTRKAPPPSKSN